MEAAMSCGFGGGFCGACGCQPCSCNYTVVLPEQSSGGGVTAAVNINLAGVGFYDSTSGNTLQFRGAQSDTPALSITLNATNHTLVFALDLATLAAALPQATTTQVGVGETATDVEAQAKASTTVFLTPSNLAALNASDTFVGLIEIATQAEVNVGTSTTLAVTPGTMTGYLTTQLNLVPSWTDSVARAMVVPDRGGQLGSETGSFTAWIASGLAAGNWNQILQLGISSSASNRVAAMTNVYVDTGASLTFNGDGSGSVNFDAGVTTQFFSTVNFDGATFQIGTLSVPANNVIRTSGTPGDLTYKAVSEFISTDNTQTGWAATNVVATRTFDAATATLGDLRNVVGTLLGDLKNVKLPAT